MGLTLTSPGSLSARRAWIEIFGGADCSEYLKVALRKESVDRNHNFCIFLSLRLVALRKESVDRNLFAGGVVGIIGRVALRKESVDRNPPVDTSSVRVSCRSPQGERG